MVEPRERNRLSGEVIRHLHTVAARGAVLMTDPRIAAVHGTSMKTIKYLVANGYIPGHQLAGNHYFEIGDISVFPTSQFLYSRFANVLPPNEFPEVYRRLQNDPEKSRLDAIDYARLITADHAGQARIPTSQRVGFLLGFSIDILSNPGIEFVPGDHGEADLTIRAGRHGLPFSMIAGIEPLGDDERNYLRNLKI